MPPADILSPYRSRIDTELTRHLTLGDTPATLAEAMRYAVFNGGKRIRPCLVYLATEALGADLALADRTACAVEYIHAYSLVHDDLPAMDDDELRRGKPTCHIKFGEAAAILAGDALQGLAYELVAGDEALTPHARLAIITALSKATGASGMVGGQMIDLESENVAIDAQTLRSMHHAKTGDLISASVSAGGLIAGASEPETNALREYGYALGLAFQVRDDILDETGDTDVMGKQAGADKARRKSTFVSLHGLNSAHAQLDDLRQAAIGALAPLGPGAGKLTELANFVATRNH